MFNESNVDNRLREFVRGRVIVATTSKVVELLEKSLKHSYPLYSVEQVPTGYMLVFCVEVDGYLTFDQDSQVRILPETSSFEKLHYDPKAFALVKAADTVVSRITSVTISQTGSPGQFYMYSVSYSVPTGNVNTYFGRTDYNPIQEGSQEDQMNRAALAVGTLWKGSTGYPGLVERALE